MASTFSAGGLASGLDTNLIIDKLVELRSGRVTQLKKRQAAFQSQVSVVGDLASKLSALRTATDTLKAGTLGVTASGTLDGLTATASSAAQAGRYTVQVDALAKAAKQRSAAFASAGAPVRGGSLGISVNGEAFNVSIADGASLNEVASAINSQVSKVSASVLSDGTNSYLSITNRETGFTVGGQASDALVITETSTGTAGQPLGLTSIATAANAKLTVDGLSFERKTNTFSDALPGVTFQLSKLGTAQELVLTNDTAGTQKNLQGFVDAYNSLLKAVQKQLAVVPLTDRQQTLSGDGAVRGLQASLQALTSRVLPGLSNVRSLADVGIKSARDGQLSIDTTVLEKAIGRDPSAINRLFADATDGIGQVVGTLVDGYTNSVNGILTVRTTSLKKTVSRLDDDIASAQDATDRYRDQLVAQYTAMEKVVSSLKNIGNYLTQQDAANKKS